MCRFARDCLVVMHERLISLESKLGPETARLGLRIGLHSGPVTAGVLRGDRYVCYRMSICKENLLISQLIRCCNRTCSVLIGLDSSCSGIQVRSDSILIGLF